MAQIHADVYLRHLRHLRMSPNTCKGSGAARPRFHGRLRSSHEVSSDAGGSPVRMRSRRAPAARGVNRPCASSRPTHTSSVAPQRGHSASSRTGPRQRGVDREGEVPPGPGRRIAREWHDALAPVVREDLLATDWNPFPQIFVLFGWRCWAKGSSGNPGSVAARWPKNPVRRIVGTPPVSQRQIFLPEEQFRANGPQSVAPTSPQERDVPCRPLPAVAGQPRSLLPCFP